MRENSAERGDKRLLKRPRKLGGCQLVKKGVAMVLIRSMRITSPTDKERRTGSQGHRGVTRGDESTHETESQASATW